MYFTKDNDPLPKISEVNINHTFAKQANIFDNSSNYSDFTDKINLSNRSSYTSKRISAVGDDNRTSHTLEAASSQITTQTLAVTPTPKPDLVIQNVAAPSSVLVGSNMQINYQIKNQGGNNAAANYTLFYLSKDQTVSDDDVYLGSNSVNSLEAGKYNSQSAKFNLGTGLAVGSYYLIFKTDGTGEIIESNENNNLFVKAINLTLIKADLIVQNAAIPTSVTVGDTIKVSYQIKNQGVGNAISSYTKFYLSKDKAISNDDTYLGYDSVNSVAAGAYSSETRSLSIVKNIVAGSYYFIYQADGYQNVIESNESNNVFSKYINVKNNYSSTNGYGLINAAAAVAKAINQNTFVDVPNLGGNNWGADQIKAAEVWAKGYTGKGITVAVVDSGVDRNHPDLSANIWKNTKEIFGNGKDDDGNGYVDDIYGWNFHDNNNNILDKNGHGTHVAGTIAGVKNSFGVTGIAYSAKIMPVKVLGDDKVGDDTAVASGIRYAVNNGANVINLSLTQQQPSIYLESAIQYASSKGAIVVMSAGNRSSLKPDYPANYAKSWGLAVGAVDQYGKMANFSNLAGSDLLAYVTSGGVNIYSTLPANKYGYLSGTSMATPHVAGAIALMLSANKSLTGAQVRQIITSTARNTLII